MADPTTTSLNGKNRIDTVEVTSDGLTSRGGLALFVRYLRAISLYPTSSPASAGFGSIRKNRKGQPISEIFKQLFCFFLDGTSRHLVFFETLKEDEGYTRAIESEAELMLSSHAVKRFFGGFWWPRIFLFRRLLEWLFLWRLQKESPPVEILGLDTMVMDNSEAAKRHGVLLHVPLGTGLTGLGGVSLHPLTGPKILW